MARKENLESIGLLVLRVGMGGYMMSHGWSKVQRVFAGEFDKFADPLGIGTGPSLVLTAGAEFVCAGLVVLGLFTRWAAIPVAFAMAVAAFVVHGSDPWSMGTAAKLFRAGEAETWSSKEPALLFLFGFLALVFLGGGRFALDAVIRKRKE